MTDFADRDGTAALEDAKEEDAITRRVQGQRESLKNGPLRNGFDAFTDLEIVTDRPTANETETIVQFKGQHNATANARLMAAAPELLAVAQLALDHLDGQEYLQACAIIAKATGE